MTSHEITSMTLASLNTEFNHIVEDNRSGSVKVLNSLISTLQKAFQSQNEIGQLTSFCQERLLAITKAHQHLVVLISFIEEFSKVIEEVKDKGKVVDWLQNYEERWSNIGSDITKRLTSKVSLDAKTILVHSNSQTVMEVLKQSKATGSIFCVIQTESRPALEGRSQANELSELGIKVKYVVDLMISVVMPQVDLVLLGADQYDDKRFLNKIGSYSIALLAQHFDKPVFVLVDSRKQTSNLSNVSKSPPHPPREVWEGAPKNVTIPNIYFESTPRSMISGIITESGLI